MVFVIYQPWRQIVNSFKHKVILLGLLLTLALALAVPVIAQTVIPNDDTTL